FATGATPPLGAQPVAVDNNGRSSAAYAGYLMWQFLEQESNVLPFTVGTYVGTKKVFNIGAGF
ncbi:MAG: porin, partial [Flavobacteriales bacterium]